MATNAALADSLMVNDPTSRHISEGHIIVSNTKYSLLLYGSCNVYPLYRREDSSRKDG